MERVGMYGKTKVNSSRQSTFEGNNTKQDMTNDALSDEKGDMKNSTFQTILLDIPREAKNHPMLTSQHVSGRAVFVAPHC